MRSFLLACALIGCRATSHDAASAPDPVVAAIAAPEGWSVVRSGSRATFADPEHALRVVIEASDRSDAKLAIADAWLAAGPAMLGAPSSIDEPPPEHGWDEQATIEYSVSERRAASAEWMRLGTRGYVALVDGDANAVAKREAQIGAIVAAVKPPGLHEEVLAGPVRAIDQAALDAFVDRALAELDVPGAAIAVTVGNKVVYKRTAGVRERGKPEPITPETMFLMASVTKPMTTMMEAALVDAGVVRWDSPVTELMPSFALGDAEITKQLRLWHMSCACTGMPKQDMEGLFEWKDVTIESRIALMRTMKPTTKLGETFQYSNPMVAAGGFIAAHAFRPDEPLGLAYAAAMRSKVFEQIGMIRTTLDPKTVEIKEHAMPHALDVEGTTRVLPLEIERQVEPIGPAGGVWSSLDDMIAYAQTELGEGLAPNGTRVVSVENYRERTKPRVAVGDGSSYALGIDVESYHGQRVLGHSGGSFGFGTRFRALPDAKAAFVILTNVRNGNAKEQLPFVEAVSRRIHEELFANARSLADKMLAYYVKLRHREPHVMNKDRSWVARLVGRYHEPLLGDLEIRETASGVIFDAGEWQSAIDVTVGPDGTTRIVMLDPPFAGPGVIVGPTDPPTLIVPDQTTYMFTRVR